MPLTVLIVGAGISGLATATALAQKGHSIHVLERRHDLSDLGAGIQILPSAVRCLSAWGIKDACAAVASAPPFFDFYRSDGTLLLRRLLNAKRHSAITYGADYFLMHRADYQRALASAATAAGAEIEFDVHITQIDPETCTIHLSDGRVLQADLIVGADGIRSLVRESLGPTAGYAPQAYTECTYRALVSVEKIKTRPALDNLLNSGNSSLWLGPNKWALAYPVSMGKVYNIVLSEYTEAPEKLPAGSWNHPASVEKVRSSFDGFPAVVTELLACTEHITQWVNTDLPLLPTWINMSASNGSVCLIGDAAHGMLPHLAAGGTTSIEDAAALGECLTNVNTRSDLQDALIAWQAVRKPRCEIIQANARVNAVTFSLADGPAQEARDALYRSGMIAQQGLLHLSDEERMARPKNKKDASRGPMDPAFSQWLLDYDAIQEMRDYLTVKQKS